MKKFSDDSRYAGFLSQSISVVENIFNLSGNLRPSTTILALEDEKYDWAVENPGIGLELTTQIFSQTPKEMFKMISTYTSAFAGNYKTGLNPNNLRIFASRTKSPRLSIAS